MSIGGIAHTITAACGMELCCMNAEGIPVVGAAPRITRTDRIHTCAVTNLTLHSGLARVVTQRGGHASPVASVHLSVAVVVDPVTADPHAYNTDL